MTRRDMIQTAMVGLAVARSPAVAETSLSVFHEDHLLAAESLRGFGAVLGMRLAVNSGSPAIYVALRNLTDRQSRNLGERVRSGDWVLIESGCSFASQQESGRHCDQIRNLFGLVLEKPVRVPEVSGHYINYRWPIDACFRHFSEFTPVCANEQETIAHVGGVPVAARKRIGKGGIFYLGSPLGPILTARDPDAKRLALSLLNTFIQNS